AWEIVDAFNDSAAADTAAAHFEQVHQAREFPTDMPTFPLKESTNIIDLLIATNLCKSKGEARRIVQQGGVRLDGETVSGVDVQVEPGEAVLQRGKRYFVRLLRA
ncbi:MAG TPA: tyrosine--tRNA ligase, partial [Dehalococcoidia bacterium]|nr:tyrosine--tRNA ligase [Dehalococcoidia bacterium]